MIEGLQQTNISLDKGIVRTPSLGQEGELSECVNLIPQEGEIVRLREPQPLMEKGKYLFYTMSRKGLFLNVALSVPAPCDINVTMQWEDGDDMPQSDHVIKKGNSKLIIPVSADTNVTRVALQLPEEELSSEGYLGLRWYRLFEEENVANVAFPKEGEGFPLELPVGYRLKAIHRCDEKDNYILVSVSEVLYYREEVGYVPLYSSYDSLEANFAVIGNVIAMTVKGEQIYFIWKDGRYLEQNLTAARVDAQLTLGETRPYYATPYASVSGRNYQVYVSHGVLKKTTDQPDFKRTKSGDKWVWSCANQQELKDFFTDVYGNIREERRKEGTACYPFYVRYGVELYDGSVVNLSAPVLMMPSTSILPRIGCYVPASFSTSQMDKTEYLDGTNNDTYKDEAYSFVPILTARHFYAAFDASQLEGMSEELIKGVVVYVTKEIELSAGEIGNNVNDITFKNVDAAVDGFGTKINGLVGENGSSANPAYVNYVYSYPASSLSTESAFRELTEPVSFYRMAMIPYTTLRDNGFKMVMTIGNGCFRKIASAKDWASAPYTDEDSEYRRLVSAGYVPFNVERSMWNIITSQPKLSTALGGQTGMVITDSNCVYNYNSRLIYGGYRSVVNPYLTVSSFLGDSRLPDNRNGSELTLYLVGDGSSKTIRAKGGYLRGYNGESLAVFSPHSEISNLCYEAGSNSGIIVLTTSDTDGYAKCVGIKNATQLESEDLTPFFVGNQLTIPDRFKADDMSTQIDKGYQPGSVAVTKVGNPWVIEQVIDLGCGEIRDLSSITEALSEGQFGEFPILAFSDEGIYALSVDSTGRISATQAISREVISPNGKVLQMDDAVAFPTVGGLKLLSGGAVKSLSNKIRGHNTDEQEFGGIEGLTIRDVLPFEQQVVSGQLVYDGYNRRIHVFNESESTRIATELNWEVTQYTDLKIQTESGLKPSVTQVVHANYVETLLQKHYVLDVEHEQWATQILSNQLIDVVPAYPFSVMLFGGKMLRYSDTVEEDKVKDGWLLTRPISFRDPFVRKMLADIRVFGQKTHPNTEWSVQVYISNDRVKWHRLTSLKARSAKWYRFLIKAKMNDTDTLSGITCQYVPRLGSKLR